MQPPELRAEVTDTYPNVRIDERELSRVLDVTRWRTRPTFPSPGRTAWLELKRPATYDSRSGAAYSAAKIKGVGLWNPAGYLHTGVRQGEHSSEPIQPTVIDYEPMRRLKHVGISPRGDFVEVTSFPAPYGGLLHPRARLEFTNAATLLEYGVPSVAPLAVIRYPDLVFGSDSLGAVVTLSTERRPFRVHVDYIDEHGPEERAYFLEVYRLLGIEGDPHNPYVQWRAYQKLAGRLGALLRGFAEAGLYRYASQLENLHFDATRGELFVTDLDSSRRLDDLPIDIQPLQVLRDIASALHKIAWRLHYFVTLDLNSIDAIRAEDPLAALVAGYFMESSGLEIETVVEPLWRLIIPHLFLRKRHRNLIGGWERERIRSYEVDRDLFFCLAMLTLFDLFAHSTLAAKRGGGLTLADLRRKIGRFLGPERCDYLCWLAR